MGALLLKAGRESAGAWLDAFAKLMPELEVRVWPDCGKREEILFSYASRLPYGEYLTFPNLRFIGSTSVGLEPLLDDPTLPAHVPVIRSINPHRTSTMAEYVTLHVLRHFRSDDAYHAQQKAKIWKMLPQRDAADVRVGMLGCDTLGKASAAVLRLLRFDLASWTRTPHNDAGIRNFFGADGLKPFLARTDILVCLLPLTAQTNNILDAGAFAALPKGAYFINAARGEHVVDSALLAALDSGHLSGATLDPFRDEPLPQDDPYWNHPKVTVTPHSACQGFAKYGAPAIIENVRRALDGRPLINVADRAAGY